MKPKIFQRRCDVGRNVADILDRQFGRLLVLAYVGHDVSDGKPHVMCQCSCGNQRVFDIYVVRSGWVKSCGCLHSESARRAGKSHMTHGLSKTRIYSMWRDMQTRCYNPKFKFYRYYGGRGITVCDQWRGRGGFDVFLKDMGHPKDGQTLERKDNNKGYCPENCKWLAHSEQSKNRLYNWQILSGDSVITAIEASRLLGRSKGYVDSRLRKSRASKRLPVAIEKI